MKGLNLFKAWLRLLLIFPKVILWQYRPDQNITNSLPRQSEAILQFIEDKNLKEITIAGHSEGGDEAVFLTDLIQTKRPDIRINGLILMESVGLYDQDKLAGKFIADANKTTATSVKSIFSNLKHRRNPFELSNKSLQAGVDILFGIAKEAIKSKMVGYMGEQGVFKNQVREMSQLNPRLQEVKVPVVMVQAAEDLVSSINEIVPNEKINPEKISLEEGRGDKMDELMKLRKAREEYIKQNFFPNSPEVKLVVPEKIPHHGLPLFRSESVARASLGLLERFRRSAPTQVSTESAIS